MSIRLSLCCTSVTLCGLLACSGDSFQAVPAGSAGLGGGTSGAAGTTDVGGSAGGSQAGAAGSGTAGASSGAGGGGSKTTGGGAGNGGSAGTGDPAGAGGVAGGGGAAVAGAAGTGSSGDAGTSGSAGVGGGGPVMGGCAAMAFPPNVAPQLLAATGGLADLNSLKIGETKGVSPRLVMGTCGVIAASRTTDDILVQYLDSPDTAYSTGTAELQSIAMTGESVLVATQGDALRSFRKPRGDELVTYDPPSAATPTSPPGTYRSVATDGSLFAWTGRQGNGVVLLTNGLTCDPATPVGADCFRVIQTKSPADATLEPAWGITFARSRIWWLGPSATYSVATNDFSSVRRDPTEASGPGSLVATSTHLVRSSGDTLIAYRVGADGKLGTASARKLGGEVRDFVLAGTTLFALVSDPDAFAVTNFTKLTETDDSTASASLVVIHVPTAASPESLAVATDGAYFSANGSAIYKIPAAPVMSPTD